MKKAIVSRKSVRTYNGVPLTEEHENILKNYLSNDENLVGVFGNEIKIYFVKSMGENADIVGTYGIIKKAPAYLVTVCDNTKEAMIDCGYVFEKLILFLETLKIHTCWLGGTYKRKQLNLQETLKENEFIPIISPVGYAGEKASFTDKVIRKMAKSDNREVFDSRFFEEDFKHKITDASQRELLEYIRLAPSASNKQPWRVVMTADRADFYLQRTPNYGGDKLGYDIQMIDMGIALCHYDIVLREKMGAADSVVIKPSLFKVEKPQGNLAEGLEYIISVY